MVDARRKTQALGCINKGELFRQFDSQVATLQDLVAEGKLEGHRVPRVGRRQQRVDVDGVEPARQRLELVTHSHDVNQPIYAIDVVVEFDLIVLSGP